MFDTYGERMAAAIPHEDRVLYKLREEGWNAWPFGQALFSDELREHLRRIKIRGKPSLIRWISDIIAVRGNSIMTVDPKAGRLDTPNHAIEKNALESAHKFSQAYGIEDWFVFRDGSAISASDLIAHPEWLTEMDGVAVGRTPFWLFSKEHTHPFFNNWEVA